MPSDRPSIPWDPFIPATRNLERILAIEVPLVVVIAEQRFPLGKLADARPGTVIEFEKPSDSALELMIADRPIAQGNAVLVGDRFGLQITEIQGVKERIQNLGPRR